MDAKNTLESTGHLSEKNKLIIYIDVNEMSNIYKFKKKTNFVRILHITI